MQIYSVIVSYNPDVPALASLCKQLIDNNCSVIIVDNTEASHIVEDMIVSGCTLIALNENTGVAHAQNVGIRAALDMGAEIIVFFDQDSKVDADFLPSLVAPLKAGKPGVVAPVFFDDAQSFEFPSFRLNCLGYPVKIYRGGKTLPYNVDIITSSGSAATAVTFDVAGLMDEDFFIDFVDTEWSLRCRKKNIPVYVVPAAVMRHTVGRQSINFRLLRGFVHGPSRTYYKVRNCFLLFRKKSVPFLVAAKETTTAFIHNAATFFFLKDKASYMQNYMLAFAHGLKGVVGKKPI